MMFKRGDVILVLFPNSDLRTSKRRPALVVQTDDTGRELPQTIVTMITSNLARATGASRVPILLNSDEGKRGGLKTDSVVMTDNVATVHYNEIDRFIGSLSGLKSVDSALRYTFSL